jgi:hypothetical protein
VSDRRKGTSAARRTPPVERDSRRGPNVFIVLPLVAAALVAALALRAASSGAAAKRGGAPGSGALEEEGKIADRLPAPLPLRPVSIPPASNNPEPAPDPPSEALAAESEPETPVSFLIHPECREAVDCGPNGVCSEGRCLRCREDAECGAGRACAMGLCLRASNAACRSNANCTANDLCVLAVPDADPSDIENTRAACARDLGR